jgi:hypothetical protein
LPSQQLTTTDRQQLNVLKNEVDDLNSLTASFGKMTMGGSRTNKTRKHKNKRKKRKTIKHKNKPNTKTIKHKKKGKKNNNTKRS